MDGSLTTTPDPLTLPAVYIRHKLSFISGWEEEKKQKDSNQMSPVSYLDGTMRQLVAVRLVLNFWLVVSLMGDDILADLGSGYILDTPQDQPKHSRHRPQDTNTCQLTFVTPHQESCLGKDDSAGIKEDVKYFQNLLQDHNRVLQSLKYTVNADAQDLGYQQVISEHNKGIRRTTRNSMGR
ncbi:unnamed protein product [Ranitomeya imitator]|uniref:Uncharacterized protein n=1 Tax=Ranitomeya imitator TaxID=111125 RepID=A0ABN9KZM7_9NEOB|nr:unnamed protein product [Ranitomeya imitator]